MKTTALQEKSSREKFVNQAKSKYGFIDKDGIYNLSDFELEKLRRADEQLSKGEFITQEEMDLKVSAWLNEE